MNTLYLVCFLVVGNHSDHTVARDTVQQCEIFEAHKLTNDALDSMLAEAAEKYDACETPLVSVRKLGKIPAK